MLNKSNGWDSLVDPYLEMIPWIGDKIPSAYRIWLSARRYLLAGDTLRAERCERLNYLLHNSYVPAQIEFRGEVIFAYGGIGVILHPKADIFEYVTIGAHVTIGGNGKHVRTDERNGTKTTVPRIETMCTIGACANITGGITIGGLSIIAPNAVVTHNAEPGSILAGIPAKKIGQITLDNALSYKTKFLPARSMTDDEFILLAQKILPY